MITVLLAILKTIGIILLCVLLLLLLLLALVLFVPIRYRITASRKAEDAVPIRVSVRATWLLHSLSAAFRYPEQAYLRVRLFGFTIFSTREEGKEKKSVKSDKRENEPALGQKDEQEEGREEPEEERTIQEDATLTQTPPKSEKNVSEEESEQSKEDEPALSLLGKLLSFLRKLIDIFKNIQYTIGKICGKIKEVINNIRYYLEILQSDCFKRAFASCRGEAFRLLRSIFPYRVRGSLLIGTGDPAGTAQIIGLQGILYPLIGDHITVTPDFEHTVMEGDLSVRGKITLFRAVKTALKIYFNKDLRRVIRLLKKEAA